ncbi:MAG: metal ABC transporter permease [Armatimonadetes bacterium]|nr:metal ABC transporter permease [Armatimonadota bacterium]
MVTLLTDYTTRTILLGTLILGISCGVLGVFAVLRRQSLVGDLLAHATLPGVALAFLLTESRNPALLMLGAAVTGIAAVSLATWLSKRTPTDLNTCFAVTLTSFFGLGAVLLSIVQKSPTANQAGLDKYLFGQVAGLTQEQVILMTILGSVALVGTIALTPSLKVLTFDPTLARISGLKPERVELIQTGLMILVIALSISSVGVILVSALIVAPAVIARQWTQRLSVMITLSALVGGAGAFAGSILSIQRDNTPTGPMIVVILALGAVTSVLFGTALGVVPRRLRAKKSQSGGAS